jgi:ketosteroid isomerase-like protein
VTVESTMESVTIRGTVAIVRDRWRFKRPDGTATEWRLGTSVWVKNDAQWQLAAFQASPVGQEDVQPQAVAAARAIGTTGKVTPPPTGGVEREVWKANEGITTAFERRDARAWSALTADGYVAVYPDGSMEAKSARLKMLESNTLERTPGSAPTRWQDVRIRVFGDTAILTAVQVRGTADDPIARRLTRVFVRDDGWRQLGVHFTLVTAE